MTREEYLRALVQRLRPSKLLRDAFLAKYASTEVTYNKDGGMTFTLPSSENNKED